MFKALDSMVHIAKSRAEHHTLCQDRAIAVRDDDLVILAVADGMDSYRYSELAAEFSVNFVREHAKELISAVRIKERGKGSIIWEEKGGRRAFNKKLREIMFDLRDGLLIYAISSKIRTGNLHCTLSFSIISPEAFLNVSIGDSPLYTLMDDGARFMDGNDNGSEREDTSKTYSVLDMDSSIDYMVFEVGLTKHLRSVLITSDGAIDWDKQEWLLISQENFADLPDWYYDMLREKKDLDKVVEEMVEWGYGDVGVAYYVHDKSLLS
jgi:serine/threonine protein phosphatase PrpC